MAKKVSKKARRLALSRETFMVLLLVRDGASTWRSGTRQSVCPDQGKIAAVLIIERSQATRFEGDL
jgi:hypothetical protein